MASPILCVHFFPPFINIGPWLASFILFLMFTCLMLCHIKAFFRHACTWRIFVIFGFFILLRTCKPIIYCDTSYFSVSMFNFNHL
jgi:hypothetical protein